MPKKFYNVPEKIKEPISKTLSKKKIKQLKSQTKTLKTKIANVIDPSPNYDEYLNHDIRKILYQRYSLSNYLEIYEFKKSSKRFQVDSIKNYRASNITKFVVEEMLSRFRKNISFKKQKIYLSRLHKFMKIAAEADKLVIFKSNLLNHSREIVNIDVIYLYRTLENLISNAYNPLNKRFGESIDKFGKINVNLSLKKNNLVLSVSDNGAGMNKEQLQKLRDGVRTTSTKDQTELHGIGMLSVRRCVDYHKGSIEIDSEEGKGSKFVISIPVR